MVVVVVVVMVMVMVMVVVCCLNVWLIGLCFSESAVVFEK